MSNNRLPPGWQPNPLHRQNRARTPPQVRSNPLQMVMMPRPNFNMRRRQQQQWQWPPPPPPGPATYPSQMPSNQPIQFALTRQQLANLPAESRAAYFDIGSTQAPGYQPPAPARQSNGIGPGYAPAAPKSTATNSAEPLGGTTTRDLRVAARAKEGGFDQPLDKYRRKPKGRAARERLLQAEAEVDAEKAKTTPSKDRPIREYSRPADLPARPSWVPMQLGAEQAQTEDGPPPAQRPRITGPESPQYKWAPFGFPRRPTPPPMPSRSQVVENGTQGQKRRREEVDDLA